LLAIAAARLTVTTLAATISSLIAISALVTAIATTLGSISSTLIFLKFRKREGPRYCEIIGFLRSFVLEDVFNFLDFSGRHIETGTCAINKDSHSSDVLVNVFRKVSPNDVPNERNSIEGLFHH
jgi:hypothetical protein